MTSLIIRLGLERVVQEMVEQEVTDYLEREHHQRRRPVRGSSRLKRHTACRAALCTILDQQDWPGTGTA